jgi:DNA repair photolyase
MSLDMKGRGAGFNPPNRFDAQSFEPMEIDVPCEDDEPRALKTIYFRDRSKTVLSKNDSPDIGFTYSINPYRGCSHGCNYCYARPSHEYLGFSAGLDFESKIVVKDDAPELLRAELSRKSWVPQMVCMSGNTDCYQPVERALGITRRCLEVFRDFRNPVGIITKNAMVTRDVDVLRELAARRCVHVVVSVTTLDAHVARVMEPRTSTPARRLEAVRVLAEAGVPVGVNVAPVIPGLTDEEIPAILKAAREAGATSAGMTIVRLPGAVKPLFLEWLAREFPLRAPKVLARLRDIRGDDLTDARFGTRQSGEGEVAAMISQLFDGACKRLGLGSARDSGLDASGFSAPGEKQGELFSGPSAYPGV